MAIRTLVVPEPAGGQPIVLSPRIRTVEQPGVPRPPRAYPVVTVVGGGSPPATPSLAIADNGNGTGATATITGSAVGSVVTVKTALLLTNGAEGFTATGSRSGDGTINLPLADGTYLAYAQAAQAGLLSDVSQVLAFGVTGPNLPGGGTVTPNGHQGIIQAGVAWLIASSPNFQALVGAASADLALAHVPLEADDTEESGSTRPRAIVHQVRFKLEKLSLLDFRPAGEIWVSFEFPVSPSSIAAETPRETRLRDERLAFFNLVDPILQDCANLQGTGTGYGGVASQVALSEIELLDGPSAIEEVRAAGQQGERPQYFWGATYCFYWRG